ncbi:MULTISPECIES: hypothetical protein [Campylobacter]|uniref:hypothetical protein n=1 Tax=Campylobacter TaxID=194 RepID=UPI000873BA23|nr:MULTISPECIES: hypothetical protein [Campylobacter]EAJ5475651.1 hypothetical protein [Campylobacter jejuni]ELT9983398.1 hypothetical protein [Campylobacter jejuni]OEV57213.1 hypothetical protein AJY68_02015 [Campylobacter jejuni]OEW25162.1 hypothetical protein AJ939_01215 [Campylobacter sp. BCW_6889]OEW27197.1 hypothetical protein AJ874_02345 [Campylobacter jejuni]
MKKPFYKLKRFYIPCGLLIAFVIFISLAYRPLELIFWDKYYYEKENQIRKETSKLFWSNEEEFKKVFVEQNLNQELKLNQKELLNYMHNFKKDFKFMQILGLDNAYLVALRNKVSIFGRKSETNLNYFYLASNSTTNLNEMNNFISIMDRYIIFINKIDALPDTYALMKIAFNADYFLFNLIPFASSLDKNFMCSIPQKEQLLENMINSYKKMNLLYKTKLKTEIQEMIYPTIYEAKRYNYFINIAKGRLNACGK